MNNENFPHVSKTYRHTDSINRDLFKAVFLGKWLHIEYKNTSGNITSYWIGIKNINPVNKTLSVEGFHLNNHTILKMPFIYIDSILSSKLIDGSYYPKNEKLINDIINTPDKYQNIFENIPNLKILNYLENCNLLDTTPYKSDFELVRYLDNDVFENEVYPLSDEQFEFIVKTFQKNTNIKYKYQIQQLALNVLSIYSKKGLYVLAYKRLDLDVKKRCLVQGEEIIINKEFTLANKYIQSIRKYLDADDYELLNDFENNQEYLKDKIADNNVIVDDMPYIIGLGFKINVDLAHEYHSIMKMYKQNNLSTPLKAFFGELLSRKIRIKNYPVALINEKINLDQLLAINNAMKYPLAYIQGPPGTGKTNTILNTVSTAFCNDKTVLFSSFNNHPIDEVYKKLKNLTNNNEIIPFPILRLGNNEKVEEAINTIIKLVSSIKNINNNEFSENITSDEKTKKLAHILKQYENILDLKERSETIERLIEHNKNSDSMMMLAFNTDLSNRQKKLIDSQINQVNTMEFEEALSLISNNLNNVKSYIYNKSIKHLKRFNETKYDNLREIIFSNEIKMEQKVSYFNKYISNDTNLKMLLRVFPIILTTCISAHKLGEPKPVFDMTIIDEASQCNNAVSLIPVIRGKSLMLVGDPQQLQPVITLDKTINEKLKKQYNIKDEYDYCNNSIYKTFLSCDAVSDEILLSYHYRCHKKIIEYNNKKYYQSKLKVLSSSTEEKPLVFVNVNDNEVITKNTSLNEALLITKYVKNNPNKTIGIITPFVNQKKLIEKYLYENNIHNVVCGTIHAFQGDEKDEILFSTAITEKTSHKTYNWLKNNKELINVASSRARDKLIMFADYNSIKKLNSDLQDDLFELANYIKNNGEYQITKRHTASRALGVKPFSSDTEEAFLKNLTHALENIWRFKNRFIIREEVPISQVFLINIAKSDLFYTGRFDFVVYEKIQNKELPILAIELDGKEHFSDETVKIRDNKKNSICKKHGLKLIRVENSYARRYNHIKEILTDYFKKLR